MTSENKVFAMRREYVLVGSLLVSILLLPAATAQVLVDFEQSVTIDSGRGVDPQLDYASLVHIGPWDDRNYAVTR
jgi:hypothetical protein